MMSDIAEMQLLIKKEQQRGDEFDEKMTNEQRLLEEAEDKKLKIIRKMLQQQLEELQRAKHDEGTAADRNPEKESMYFGASI